MGIIKQKLLNSSGQTLIETLAGLFILVMGVTAAVGLAVYALNASSGIIKQIIATGLAREGVEAVRNMRDTNWLNITDDPVTTNGCYNYVSSNNSQANCHKSWLGKNGSSLYCLDPSTGNGNNCNGNNDYQPYYLGFNTGNSSFWILNTEPINYGINFNNPAVNNNWQTSGFYSEDGNTLCTKATSEYCRRIAITVYNNINNNAIAPYNKDNNLSLVFVQSQVWCVDKKCPRVDDFPNASSSCRLELDTYLT